MFNKILIAIYSYLLLLIKNKKENEYYYNISLNKLFY